MPSGYWKKRRERRSLKIATQRKKLALRLCLTPFCRRMARYKRRYCNTCRSRMYDDPLKVLFWNLRKSAKRRGKTFTITWPYFRDLAVSSGYDEKHGKGAHDLTIDRIKGHIGYEPGNLQVLTRSENSKKSWVERNNWVPV